MDLEEAADELYGLAMDQFTEARNSRAKQLKDAGDGKTAAAVRALRKPSQAAWLANRIVRRHPKEIKDLLALGSELRHAQDQNKGAELRRLSSDRQAFTRRVLRLAADEAETAGMSFGSEVERQLAATIEAAIATESAGAALERGRLSEGLSHVGFGGAGTTEAFQPVGQRRTGKKVPESALERGDAGRGGLDEAEQALTKAQASLDVATAGLDQARQRRQSAIARQRDIAAELHAAERAVVEASKEIEAAVMKQKRESAALGEAKRELQRRTRAGQRTERQK